MAEGVNVRFSGALQKFVEQRSHGSGLYGSASEYIRDLVRRDYEREEERRWAVLRSEMSPGMEAAESEFLTLDPAAVLSEARKRSGLKK